MAVLSMANAMVRVPVFGRFLELLCFCACARLVVQPDAWERYGERTTRCFEFGAAGQRADSRVENAVRAAAPTTFRSGNAAEAKPVLYLHQLPEQ